jgi:hypothetical protein
MYVRNAFWVCLAVAAVYYSNFFHNLFHNKKINEVFFQIAIAGYTIIHLLMLYTTFVIQYWYKIKSIEEYNPKLVPVGAVIGFISILALLIAIWPVWGVTSLLLFISMWKGFFSLPVFLPVGIIGIIFINLGDTLFFVINIGTVLSFYFI